MQAGEEKIKTISPEESGFFFVIIKIADLRTNTLFVNQNIQTSNKNELD
jgi:hypothetical protein